MEAQGGADSPDRNKDSQKLLKPSNSGELAKDASHHPQGEEEAFIPRHTSSLLHVADRRQPLSSVSSLEVHFDLLDLTELTDTSDQELAEVFVDSDEENPESPASARAEAEEEEARQRSQALPTHRAFQTVGTVTVWLGHHHHHLPLHRGGYLRSPSLTRCSKAEHSRDRKLQSDSDSRESYHKEDRPQQP